jgi:hypothetical protein
MPEIGRDKIRMGIEKPSEPIRAPGKAEVPVLLLKMDNLTPLRPELAVWTALLVGEELFLPDAVVAAVGRLVEPVAFLEVGQDTPDGFLVERGRGGRPAVIGDAQRLPER